MTTNLEQAARLALEVLVKSNPITSDEVFRKVEAIFSLRVALAEPAPTEPKRPINCGSSQCSCIECVMENGPA